MKLMKVISIFLILILIGSGIIFFYGQKLLSPVKDQNPEDKLVIIKTGCSLNQISNRLYEERLIKNPLLFRLYLQLKGWATKVQAGYYQLNSTMSSQEIAKRLVVGNVATYKVTFPEGMTIEEMGNLLADRGLDKERFISLAKSRLNPFDPKEEETRYNLEGFLFPDTYQIPYGSNEEDIIEIMLKEFETKIKGLEEELAESEYSLYEIITMASLIQDEAKLEAEGPIIASVIYNRLEENMRLQIDATIQYILPERKSRLLYSDLEVDSSYNTYRNYGLPPGPINNPGIEAIRSALSPADTDYLYYVVIEGDKHKFTKSYKEHLEVQKRLKYKK